MTDLSELAALADGKDAPPEKVRAALAQALELLAEEKEQSARYLDKIIAEHGPTLNDNLIDDCRHSMRVLKRDLAALHVGRSR